MHISFSPQLRNDALTISKSGDVLTINGKVFDFSVVGEGDDLPEVAIVESDFVEGITTRVDGRLHITLRLPYSRGGHVEAPPPLIDPSDGVLALPSLDEELPHAD